MQQKKLDFIQMLRGIAALAVTFVHIHQHTAQPTEFASWLLRPTASGVDLFFMISGFIMVYTTRDSDGTLRYAWTFMLKRLTRIWPTYATLTVIYIPIIVLSGVVIGRQDIDPTVWNFMKSMMFIPIGLDMDGPFWGAALLHTGWTLNYEVYFYAVFAISMLFRRAAIVFFALWLIFTLTGLPLLFFGHASFDAGISYGWGWKYLNLITSPMIWEFFIGVITAHLYFSRIYIASREACWILLSIATSLMIWILWGFPLHSRGFGMTDWGIAYAIFFPTIVIVSKTLTLRQPRFLVWLGNISFSLYLVHPIIVHPIANLLYEIESIRPALGDFPFGLVLMSISIGSAALSYHLLEERLSTWCRRKLLEKKRNVSRHNFDAAMAQIAEEPSAPEAK
jgi:exopolysaccharide production protein ExoZ